MKKILYLSSALNLNSLYFAKSPYVVFLLQLFRLVQKKKKKSPFVTDKEENLQNPLTSPMSDVRLVGIPLI